MKKQIRNTIAVLLALFYTAGLMGFHVAKHECSSCEEKNYDWFLFSSNISELFCGIPQTDATNTEMAISSANDTCCSTYVSQYKTAPETPQHNHLKVPVVSQIVLLTHFYFTSILTENKDLVVYINAPPLVVQMPTPDLLCCFLC